jgi:hypothetical protein
MRVTSASSDLADVLAAEWRMLNPSVRRDAAALEELLDTEFTELGASGRIWTRGDLIAHLTSSPELTGTAVSEMRARHVTTDVILVEYETSDPSRTVRRSSWWRRTEHGRWRCVFHQGTPLEHRRYGFESPSDEEEDR